MKYTSTFLVCASLIFGSVTNANYITFVKSEFENTYIGFGALGGSSQPVAEEMVQDEYSINLNLFDSVAITDGKFQAREGNTIKTVTGVLIQLYVFDKNLRQYTETVNILTENMLYKRIIRNKVGNQ